MFKPASVNVFIGPNHSGKSLLLSELYDGIRQDVKSRWKVLDSVSFVAIEDAERERLMEELRGLVQPSIQHPGTVEVHRGLWTGNFGKAAFESHLSKLQTCRSIGENELARLFILAGNVLKLDGGERLGMLRACGREGPRIGRYGQLLSRLFYQDRQRKITQDIIHDAFGCYLVIDPLDQNFEAKISTTAPLLASERSLSEEAVAFYGQATKIDEMSDGVRAFCGMIASVVASDAKLILIDEPEAFLHPALCSKLAKELCRTAIANNQQLYVATHSAAFLMGCVQAGVDLNIVRLTYRNRAATSRLLQQEKLVPLMRQPLLRSVGALTGIFYESVVVTESDSDRAFYDEINHRCLNSHDSRGIADTLFLNAQNWQTTARIVAPLRQLGVAAAAIVDADILLEGNSQAFQTLMEAAGMPPASRTSLGQLRGQLHTIMKPIAKTLKENGVSCVTGDERHDLENFIGQLAKYGVFVVPVGELECWLPDLQRNVWSGKSEWLLNTFEAMGEDSSSSQYLNPSSGDVWEFLGRVGQWLNDPHRVGMPN